MNARIAELDRAAQEYAGRIVGNDEDSNYTEWFNVYKEKFAELIVRECADVASEHVGEIEGVDFGLGPVVGNRFGIDIEP